MTTNQAGFVGKPFYTRIARSDLAVPYNLSYVGFEVFTAATTKNVVFFMVTLCGPYKNRLF
jgi:hypothetical protein